MTDRVTTAKRSQIMSRIRSKNTAPELIVRKMVYSLGYRYRLHSKKLPGHPDLVFSRQKKVIFVHGCFWHCHGCKKGQPPKSRLGYWLPKLKENQERDARNQAALGIMGWRFLIIWQCEMRSPDQLKRRIEQFLKD